MSKLFFLTSIVLLLFANVQASTTFEVRGSGLFPTKSRFQKIYGKPLPCFELQASTDFIGTLSLWANYNRLKKEKPIPDCCDASVRLSTISLGLNHNYSLNKSLTLYAGIGLSYANILLKNKFSEIVHRSKKNVLGGVIKSGCLINLQEVYFLDLFADYYYQPLAFAKKTDCGGVRVGAGFGVNF